MTAAGPAKLTAQRKDPFSLMDVIWPDTSIDHVRLKDLGREQRLASSASAVHRVVIKNAESEDKKLEAKSHPPDDVVQVRQQHSCPAHMYWRA